MFWCWHLISGCTLFVRCFWAFRSGTPPYLKAIFTTQKWYVFWSKWVACSWYKHWMDTGSVSCNMFYSILFYSFSFHDIFWMDPHITYTGINHVPLECFLEMPRKLVLATCMAMAEPFLWEKFLLIKAVGSCNWKASESVGETLQALLDICFLFNTC